MSTRIHPITMPKWGIEMQEGTITAWHGEPGKALSKGDLLLDVETEKIVNTVESPIGGTLRRIIAAAGETHAVGSLIGIMAPAEVGESEIDDFIASFKPADAGFEPDGGGVAAPEPPSAATPAPAADGGSGKVSPIARRVAEKLGIDVSQVPGTGRNGRVSKEDVEAYAKSMGLIGSGADRSATATALSNEPVRERMTSMRLTIARRLSESKQTIPHYRVCVDVDATAMLAERKSLAERGTRVSVNDLLLRACALTLREHPKVNAQYQGDEVLKFPHADIAVAVATDAGLVTPIVRMADTKDLATIAAETTELAGKARSGTLSRDEITGGTFTISNLGMFGVDRFDAIINPPQVAILAAGAIAERAVARDGKPATAPLMSLELSCDHRVVDGAAAGQFLGALKARLEAGGQT